MKSLMDYLGRRILTRGKWTVDSNVEREDAFMQTADNETLRDGIKYMRQRSSWNNFLTLIFYLFLLFAVLKLFTISTTTIVSDLEKEQAKYSLMTDWACLTLHNVHATAHTNTGEGSVIVYCENSEIIVIPKAVGE